MTCRRIRITPARLWAWRRCWPCSTLATGWLEVAPNGDLVDLGGKLATADVDSYELKAFQADAEGGGDNTL